MMTASIGAQKRSLPDKVRLAAAAVAAAADSVHINYDKLSAYAGLLLENNILPQMTDLDRQTLGAGKTDL